MQGTMVSVASMASFGSLASERSHYSLVRRGCLSKGNWVKKKRWHCVSLSVCKYSATTAQLTWFLNKVTPIEEVKVMIVMLVFYVSRLLSRFWCRRGLLGNHQESIGILVMKSWEVLRRGIRWSNRLEKAEKLETSRVSKPGRRRESRVVNKSIPSNTNGTNYKREKERAQMLLNLYRERERERERVKRESIGYLLLGCRWFRFEDESELFGIDDRCHFEIWKCIMLMGPKKENRSPFPFWAETTFRPWRGTLDLKYGHRIH